MLSSTLSALIGSQPRRVALTCLALGCSGPGQPASNSSAGGAGGISGAGGSPAGGTSTVGGSAGAGGAGTGVGGVGGGAGAGGAALGGSAGMAGLGGVGGASGSGAGTGGVAAAGGTAGMGGVAGSAGSGGMANTSAGCGRTTTLTDSGSSNMFNYNMLASGGETRQFILRLPEDYDNMQPHRLILGFHGATNNGTHVAGNPAFFGLYELSEGSAIFIAPDAVGGIWSDTNDVVLVDDILALVEEELCIDRDHIFLQGFSQGAAMARVLACERPGVFRAAAGHSAGGLPLPTTCDPIPYFGSLGLDENGGQETQTDFFATENGCTITTLAAAPSGGHLCSDYEGCPEAAPVRWCPYDGGHTPLPNDSGQGSSWMPEEVWAFFSQF